MLISVLIPVYQNKSSLEVLTNVVQGLDWKGESYEFVFVDDGSTDGSGDKLRKIYNENKNVNVIGLTKNFGQIAAIQAGLKVANGDCIIIISADMQDSPELITEMVEKWKQGVKVVVAERKEREEKLSQRFISGLFWKIVNKLAVKDYPIGGFDYCLIDQSVQNILNKSNEKNTHIFALIFSLGFRFEKIYYKRKRRHSGKSQWTLAKKIKMAVDTIVAFSYFPVRFISCMGILLSIFGFIYSLAIVCSYFIWGNPYHGWTTIIVLITLFGGLMLFTMGILGEYIWRILDEVRKRPHYVIDYYIEKKEKD